MLEATKSEKNNENNKTYVFQNLLEENTELKNITLRSDGRYMGRKQVNGNSYIVYAKTQKQCLAKLKQSIKTKKEKPKTNYLLYEWLDNWYKTYKEPFISLDTAIKIKRVINHIKTNMDDINLSQLTTQNIQKYLNTIPTSRKKEFIVLYFNASLQKAEDISIIQKNPFKAVIKDKKLNNIRQGYSIKEQQIILDEIKGTDIENLILIYLITGIRKNELKTINIDTDLNVKNKTLKIQSEKKRGSKNKYRYIDLTESAISLLIKSKEQLKTDTDYIYRQLKTILDKHKIKTGIHRLRHTFATNHFYLGTPIKLVSSWLGHETIDLTQNIYTHIDRTITKEDILKLYNNLYYRI